MKCLQLSLVLALVTSLACSTTHAQTVPQLTPFPLTGDLYVTDSGNDAVFRLQDLNLDGDFNDAGEVVEFYNDALGNFALTNNAGISVGPRGTLYVSDSTVDIIIALRDIDGDGNANGATESWIFFDGNPANNGSGISMTSGQDLTVDANGVVWVANSNTTSGGVDAIIRLEDLGGTVGANDVGEAILYYTPSPGGSVGDSIPSDVKVGPNGDIYYTEVSSTGALAKGVYRLHDDVIPNGNCNDPGEATPYFIPSSLGGNPFHWGFCFDELGDIYLADNGNDVIWKGIDLDNSLSIGAGTAEEVLYWNPGVSSTTWMLAAATGGALFTAESQSPDRILRMSDTAILNGNVNDPGEVIAVYDETVSTVNIGNPRSIAFARRPTLLASTTIPIGTTTSVQFQGTQGHAFQVYYSTQPTSVPFPPFGTLGIAPLASPLFGFFYGGAIPSTGIHILTIMVPFQPAAIGSTLYFQGVSGNAARMELSNPVGVTFM